MSEILDSFPANAHPVGRGQPRLYPWAEWTDGQIYQLTAGRDFPTRVGVKGIAKRCTTHARNHGLKVRTHKVDDTTIIVQFT